MDPPLHCVMTMSTPSACLTKLPLIVILATTATAFLAFGAMAWRESTKTPPPNAPFSGPIAEPLSQGGQADGIHSVIRSTEAGAKVVKVRVTPNGDEITVDAETGRVLSTKPPAVGMGRTIEAR